MAQRNETLPTTEIYGDLTLAYEFFNDALFGDTLPDCIMILQRRKGARGYFWAGQWHHNEREGSADEIALNPDTFGGRSVPDLLSTLVHEMAHLWQQHFGKPGRGAYHNKQWAEKMVEIGLTPVSIDNPGKMTGQKVTHTIAPGGAFEARCAELMEAAPFNGLGWFTTAEVKRKAKGRSKTKYRCPQCDLTVWGKPDLHVTCGEHGEELVEA